MEDRQTSFDCLRIMAAFAVMILHIAAQNWHVSDVRTFEWNVFNCYDGMVRWAVPVFTMISGALFLSKNQSMVQIYRKNILRIAAAFAFWSVIYAWKGYMESPCGWKMVIKQIIRGHYHMWFLYMIAGLYMIVPFLRKIVESLELTKYFLGLSLMFSFVLPQIIDVVSLKSEGIAKEVDGVLTVMNLHFTMGYVFYFVYGYYLNNIVIQKKVKWIVYLLGICGFTVTVLASAVVSIVEREPIQIFYSNFTVNVMLESTMIFVFAINNLNINSSARINETIRRLSKYSFGAYLVHPIVIDLLKDVIGFHTLSYNPLISVPVLGAIVAIISFAVSWMINCIPILNKYVV